MSNNIYIYILYITETLHRGDLYCMLPVPFAHRPFSRVDILSRLYTFMLMYKCIFILVYVYIFSIWPPQYQPLYMACSLHTYFRLTISLGFLLPLSFLFRTLSKRPFVSSVHTKAIVIISHTRIFISYYNSMYVYSIIYMYVYKSTHV